MFCKFPFKNQESCESLLKRLSFDLKNVDVECLSKEDMEKIDKLGDEKFDRIKDLCGDKVVLHPQWSLLTGRVRMYALKKKTASLFSESVEFNKEKLHPGYYDFVMENKRELDEMIIETRDWEFDIFSMETLTKSYLMSAIKNGTKFFIETPQFMYLRVATFLWFPNMEKIRKIYSLLSERKISHATPTLANAGKKKPQCSSCVLMTVEDEMDFIIKNWGDVARISSSGAGIGICMDGIRHSDRSDGSTTHGIVGWIRDIESIIDSMNQETRRSTAAVYLSDWHIDIFEFLEMKKLAGPRHTRAPGLFYGLWVSDLFMTRVKEDDDWVLFCPNKAKNLSTTSGLNFEALYAKYERMAIEDDHSIRPFQIVKARKLWTAIISSLTETGGPYMMWKDAVNRKSNQSNLGVIRCSNLCSEIVEYTDVNNISSCNLASVVLQNCVVDGRFDFDLLGYITRSLVRNLNQIIDRNFYLEKVPELKYTNLRTRPIGIGVQGLADVFALLDLGWDSEVARRLNVDIFECMYYHAISESIECAKESGAYETFKGSPSSEGYFQFDLWDKEKQHKGNDKRTILSKEYDWESKRKEMMEFGLRNSLLLAIAPTATSASHIGSNEGIEAFTSLIYCRTVSAGQFTLVNKYLVSDLEELSLWNNEVVRTLVYNKGSIQKLELEKESPHHARLEYLKQKYKTAFEMPQKWPLDMALSRGPFICQSQSFNYYFPEPSFEKLNRFLTYAWKEGIKGVYYLKQMSAVDPTETSTKTIKIKEGKEEKICDISCDSCGA